MGRPFKRWRPRASQLGYYIGCGYRAAFDRALAQGLIELPPEAMAVVEAAKQSGPHADLGTIIHWMTQNALKAKFPGTTGAEAHRFTPEQLANAAALFDGNIERCMKQAQAAAARLVTVIGPRDTWLAEPALSRPWMTGHVDLLDPVAGELVDIKTTSKPPYYTHIPPAHMAQVLAYVEALHEQGVIVQKVRVVYVDAQASQWWMDCPIDPLCDEMMEYRKMVRGYAKRLQKASFMEDAVPNLGDPCEKWCPYVGLCRDRYSIAKGEIQRPPPPTIKTPTSPLGGVKTQPIGGYNLASMKESA